MTEGKIRACLWFDNNAEEAANFYASLLPDSCVEQVVRSPADTPEGGPVEGSVLTVLFTVAGQRFVGLNGGPHFTFSEAVSFVIDCDDQAEVDRLTEALSAHPGAEQCGWVKDHFGLSWQIVPRRLQELLVDPDPGRASRSMQAMLGMKRLNIAALEAAADADGR